MIKVGDKIYIPSRCSISNGSDDILGGIATVSKITQRMSGGVMCSFVEVLEVNRSFNWDQYLVHEQNKLKEFFGDECARPDPDIDTPWIQKGDFIDGKKYDGPDIW